MQNIETAKQSDIMADKTELVSELKRWCRGEGLDEAHALLVVVSENVEIAQIEETLETIKCLGKVRVRGRIFNTRLDNLMVLCETKEDLTAASVPPEVLFPVSGEAWPVVVAHSCLAAEKDFNSKLEALLQAEGRTMEDIKALLPNPPPSTNSTESILQAVGDFMQKTSKPPTESGYRRLRLFSGTQPVPVGEEQLDHWLEQAWLMVEESECTDREKKRRLMESLKGPALEIVKAVRDSSLDASPAEFLEALDSAFGTAESGDDMYFAFRLMQQQPGEKLSDFLRRLERSLSKVVQRGGLPSSCKDRARVEQLLRGAISSDLMLMQLRLRERKARPPTFLQLLSEIRAEEEYEASRMRLNTSVNQVQAKQSNDVKQTEIQSLKAEIKELKSLVASVGAKTAVTQEEQSCPVPTTTSHPWENQQECQLTALKKQVKRLQQKLSKTDNAVYPNKDFTVEATSRVVNTPTRLSKPAEEQFCYRCGENGHFVAKCQNEENHSKVIKKLIQALRLSKDNQTSTKSTAPKVNCDVKKSLVTSPATAAIPEGLIGPPSIVKLKVNGHACDALFDSGSQVTIIFEPWYLKHLPDVPLQPVSGLNLWGLSESDASYPYRGYIVVDLEYPAEVAGTCQTVTVLALICPSPRTAGQTPVIVGTNTRHVRSLVKQCRESGVDIMQTLGIQADHVNAFAPTDFASPTCDQEDDVGIVTWQGPGPLTLPPGKDLQMVCKVDLTKPVSQDILMFDSSPWSPLPGGVLLQPMVVPGDAVNISSFRILVQNQSLKETVIPVGTIMGHMYLTESVTSVPLDKPTEGAFDTNFINFGDSPVPSKWKERLKQKLSERSNVFSLTDWDVGLAKDVEHTIRLSDSRPFRQRSRRLTPADIDDVRKHLQELLRAGIIKESRSPYASPIVIVRKKNGTIRMCIDYRLLNSRQSLINTPLLALTTCWTPCQEVVGSLSLTSEAAITK